MGRVAQSGPLWHPSPDPSHPLLCRAPCMSVLPRRRRPRPPNMAPGVFAMRVPLPGRPTPPSFSSAFSLKTQPRSHRPSEHPDPPTGWRNPPEHSRPCPE